MKNNSKLIILSILFTPNNILYYVTYLNGNVIFWTSSGTKQKNTKKVTLIAITTAINHIKRKLKAINYKELYVKVKGFSKNKKVVIRYLKQSTLNISSISDKISWPHNGCKQQKIRRI